MTDTTNTVSDLYEAVTAGRKWGCIYADPPWLYSNQTTRAATRNHYEGMTIEQLCKLPIGRLVSDDAHLHLWITNAFLFEAPKIFAAWGFEFRTTLIWAKGEIASLPGHLPVGKPKIGIGNYWRNSHELMLTAVRGNAKRFNDHTMPSWFVSDRGKHSAKPEQVRTMIERASPGPYLELFGRHKVERWDVWGNQIERNLFSPGAAA